MKLILTSILTIIASVSFAASEQKEGLKFKCDWVKSASHADDYFGKGAGFTLQFIGDAKVKIIEDTFFNRTYKPCWVGDSSSCMFSFSYDSSKVWAMTSDENEKSEPLVLTQVWTTGTVGGVSEIKLFDDNENGDITIKGDDGDGTMFTENFSCDMTSPKDAEIWDILGLIFGSVE